MEKYEIESFNDSNNKSSFEREESYLRAKKKLDKIIGFYWHLASYVIVNIFLIIIIAVNLDANESIWQFGTFATALFWGVGLAFHGFGVYGPSLIFGKNWAAKKIKEYMEKDKQEMKRFE